MQGFFDHGLAYACRARHVYIGFGQLTRGQRHPVDEAERSTQSRIHWGGCVIRKHGLNQHLAEEVPAIYLYRKVGALVHKPKVQNVPASEWVGVQIFRPTEIGLQK